MERTRSADGTEIAFRVSSPPTPGEPLLLVHGTIASSADWALVAPYLREHFTLVSVDRRGRGRSGDGTGEDGYDIDREGEDVIAVMEATGARKVVAHSYGAMCVIRALVAGAPVERLLVYEPPVALPPDAPLERLDALGPEEIAIAFLKSIGTTAGQVDLIRRSPAWPNLVDAAPTVPRELRAARRWTTPPGPFELPARYLLGADTRGAVYVDGIDGLRAAFPAMDVVEIPGQQHVAHVFAAEAFARLVLDFHA